VHPASRLGRARHELDALIARRDQAMQRGLEGRRAGLGQLGAQIAALSPLAVLDRGYAVVSRADGAIVRDAARVAPGERLRVRLASGTLRVMVDDAEEAP
jgi:exodeoxyribonuclease VII large subunit